MTIADKQRASLDTLLFVDGFCREKNIRYYLAYGTLLGAIRHHGFIPWDDDVDVFVPRPDYETLLKCFHDPSGRFRLISCENDRTYTIPYAKVEDLSTARVKANGELDSHGIGIDLFPLDGLPEDKETAQRVFAERNAFWLGYVYRLEMFHRSRPRTALGYCKHLAGSAAYAVGYLNKKARELSASPYKEEYDRAKCIGAVIGVFSGVFRAFEKELFEPIDVDFEGHRLTAPAGYDEILRKTYGDYMQLPPEDKRVTTHSDDYVWKQ